MIGTIEPKTPKVIGDDPPEWSVDADWRHADGSALLEETQTWTLQDAEDVLFLDLTWSITAVPDVTIEQGAYGGFFVRMPFRSDREAKVINSSGQEGDATEQQAARWVDLRMPVNRGDLMGGIALLDHPDNPGHPAHWRVDGQRGINPAPCIPNAIELAAGDTMRYRYRLVLHEGTVAADRVDELWSAYAEVQE